MAAGASKAPSAIFRTKTAAERSFSTKNPGKQGAKQHSAKRERVKGLGTKTAWLDWERAARKTQDGYQGWLPGKENCGIRDSLPWGKVGSSLIQTTENQTEPNSSAAHCRKKQGSKRDELDNLKGCSLWSRFDFSNLILPGCEMLQEVLSSKVLRELNSDGRRYTDILGDKSFLFIHPADTTLTGIHFPS